MTATHPRCLGLIGGLGVGATVHYYRTLAKAHALRSVDLRLVMEHVDTRRNSSRIEKCLWPASGRYPGKQSRRRSGEPVATDDRDERLDLVDLYEPSAERMTTTTSMHWTD